MIRLEFYKYKGRFDDEGLVDPTGAQTPVGNTLNEFVGDYVGEQIAGFNAVQAVPEPTSAAMMFGGLALLAMVRMRRARQA